MEQLLANVDADVVGDGGCTAAKSCYRIVRLDDDGRCAGLG